VTDVVAELVHLVNLLLAALDAGDDTVAADTLERLYELVGQTDRGLEVVV
jgi:hypothetical protein